MYPNNLTKNALSLKPSDLEKLIILKMRQNVEPSASMQTITPD